jgi:hypothetical protein
LSNIFAAFIKAAILCGVNEQMPYPINLALIHISYIPIILIQDQVY